MNACVFCNKEINNGKRWHLDCLDDAVYEEWGESAFKIFAKDCLYIKKRTTEKLPFWVRKLIAEGVGEGKRHISRYKIFMAMLGFGFKKEEIYKAIIEFNAKCRPPETDKEVEYHFNYLAKRYL